MASRFDQAFDLRLDKVRAEDSAPESSGRSWRRRAKGLRSGVGLWSELPSGLRVLVLSFDAVGRRFVIVSRPGLLSCGHFNLDGSYLTMVDGLVIRSSSIHAAGCYTTRAIKKGKRVCEYDGPRFSKDEADERYKGRDITYLFSCGIDQTVIDGFGIAMFINHSCDPNCESDNVDGRVFILAIRDIAAGEELTYEYNLFDSDDDDADCYCGAEKCRGTMFSEDEVKRRARRAKSARALHR